jgi:LuxR family maltose regulon positive regulatory protein
MRYDETAPPDFRDVLRRRLTRAEWPAATELILEHWPDLVLCAPYSGDGPPPGGLPAAPPEEAIRSEPELALAFVAEGLELGDFDAAGHYLHVADLHVDRLTTDRRHRLALVLEAFRLAKARRGGDGAAVRSVVPRLLALTDTMHDPKAADTARAIGYTALGLAQLDSGDLDAAQAALARGQWFADHVTSGCALVVCASRLALLHAVRGELSSVDAAARTALGISCVHLCPPVHRAHANLALAIVHYEEDRVDDALRHAALAQGLIGGGPPLPAQPPRQRYLAAEAQLLQQFGYPPVARPELDEPLTERELEVLRQLPGNRSIGEIAAALYLSTNTVKTHLRHIYRKLGAAHRREAIQRANDLGLLVIPPR